MYRWCFGTGLIRTRLPHQLILAIGCIHFDVDVDRLTHRLQIGRVGGEAVYDVPLHHRAEDDLTLGLPASRNPHLVGVDGHGETKHDDVCVGEALREVDVKVLCPRSVGEVQVPRRVVEMRVGEPGGGVLRRVVAREGIVFGDAEPRGSGDPNFAGVSLGSRELRVISDPIEVYLIPKFDGNNCST